MSINDYNCRAPVGSKELNTVYVFFCEGGTEAILIQKINQARILKDSIYIEAAWIPEIIENNENKYFRPQSILDYFLMMAGDYKGSCKYQYLLNSDDYEIYEKIKDKVKNKDTKICLLIDTDVFFKELQQDKTYDNLDDAQIRILRENWRKNLNKRIHFLHDYTEPPIQGQDYTFMEQELNFEDFFVLFFINDSNTYKYWFEQRFGTLDNIIPQNRDRTRYFGGELDNNNPGNAVIKPAFHKLTRIANTRTWLRDWLRDNMTMLENWNECIERALKRMHENEHYTNEDGDSGLSGWPFRFGLVKFLRDHIKQGDEHGK